MENKEKKKGKHPACSKAAENVCSLSFLSGGWLVVLGPESWAAFGQTGQLVREAALFQTLLLQVCLVPAQLCCPRRVARPQSLPEEPLVLVAPAQVGLQGTLLLAVPGKPLAGLVHQAGVLLQCTVQSPEAEAGTRPGQLAAPAVCFPCCWVLLLRLGDCVAGDR